MTQSASIPLFPNHSVKLQLWISISSYVHKHTNKSVQYKCTTMIPKKMLCKLQFFCVWHILDLKLYKAALYCLIVTDFTNDYNMFYFMFYTAFKLIWNWSCPHSRYWSAFFVIVIDYDEKQMPECNGKCSVNHNCQYTSIL